MDTTQLLEAARSGDTRAIGRTLSNIENRTVDGRTALADLFRSGGCGWTTGITGTPGAGKSTLTSALLPHVLADADKVAIVAVDPSSPFSGGAILGDRVRMAEHAGDDRVFIRSVANRGSLGGISDTTPAIVAALDGLGFGEVIIETVGIGQSEVEIATTADTTIVVLSPGWGDAIQVSKAGFLEIADVFVVNKADRDGADAAVRDLVSMLELVPSPQWVPPVIETVATTGGGGGDLWRAVGEHRVFLRSSGQDVLRRRARAAFQLAAAVRQELEVSLRYDGATPDIIDAIAQRTLDPWTAAERIVNAR